MRACEQAVRRWPENVAVLHLFGVVARDAGKPEQAVPVLERALCLAPDDAPIHDALAAALHDIGQLEEAASAYRRVIALAPGRATAHNNLGIALNEAGPPGDAVRVCGEALRLDPDFPQAHNNLGNALHALGRWEEAEVAYRRAVAHAPDYVDAHNNLGTVLQDQGRHQDAVDAFRTALALRPDYAEAHSNLGTAFQALGLLERAVAAGRKAVDLQPDLAHGHNNLGTALLELGRLDAAEDAFQRALELAPDLADVHHNLANLYKERGRLEEALAACRRAIDAVPNNAESHYLLGTILQDAGRLDDALAAYREAVALDPGNVRAHWASLLTLPVVYDNEVEIERHYARWADGVAALDSSLGLETAVERRRALEAMTELTNFYLHHQGVDNLPLQARYAALLHRSAAASFPDHARPVAHPPAPADRRLRVGFLSAHIRNHSVTKLFGGWITGLDRARFEVLVYALGAEADATTAQIERDADHFHRAVRANAALLRAIAAAELDLLVFLDVGMDPKTQLPAALRLAPVQCAAFGHPVTTCLSTIDYYLSSDLMEPPGGAAHYSEQLVRLPELSVCYAAPAIDRSRAVARDPETTNDTVVYLCAQNFYKLLPQHDALFARIARAVPESIFWFIASRLPHATETFRKRMGRAFAAERLDAAERCIFHPR